MDSLYSLILKYGLPSYVTSIITPVPATAQLQLQIAKKLPTQIGRIYGLSTYTDTIAPDASPLITTTDAQAIYLNLVDGATKFYTPVRLDELNFNFAGVPTPGEAPRYMPVNLPRFDLSTSEYINPSGVISAAPPAAPTVIMLNFHYIAFEAWNFLLKQKVVFNYGKPSDGITQND
jgi:hypothetical protein